MSDDSAKAEEERIQRAMNRKARVASMTVAKTVVHSIDSAAQKQQSAAVKSPVTEKKPVVDKPKPTTTTHTTSQTSARSAEIDSLQLKK